MKKFISLLLVCLMVVPFGMLATTGVSAEASVWDGKTADIGWYVKDTAATEFEIKTAEEFFGLTVILYSREPGATVKGDTNVYYDANNKVIFDATAITETTSKTDCAKSVVNGFSGKTIKLAADIDLAGKPFTPIGSSGSFAGIFDGQNHTISNLTVGADQAAHKGTTSNVAGQYYYGLFALVAGTDAAPCVVKNLTIKNEVQNIYLPSTAKKIWAGGVSGTTYKAESIQNVKVEGLTVNITTDQESFAKIELYNAAMVGVFKSNQPCENVTITGYSVNGLDALKAICTEFTSHKYENLLIHTATAAGTGAITNCSVTEGVYVPETPSQPSQPDQPGDTPSTGDMTWVVAVVAAVAVMGSAVVLKKREN